MRLYFAYGSNMALHQMRARCPGAHAMCPARVDGWRFYVNRRGTASIKPDRTASVHGVVWRVSPQHVATLNIFEGVRLGHYLTRSVHLHTPRGKLRGFTYAGTNLHEGTPVRAYLAGTVIPAAREWNLPEEYVAELESWFRTPPIGPSRPRVRGKSWKP